MFRAIVCSEQEIVPAPAFFTEKGCYNYWYSRMKTDRRIKAFVCYQTTEPDQDFYNMRAVIIQDCLKMLKLIGVIDQENTEEVLAHNLLDKELVGLEAYQEYLQHQLKGLEGFWGGMD